VMIRASPLGPTPRVPRVGLRTRRRVPLPTSRRRHRMHRHDPTPRHDQRAEQPRSVSIVITASAGCRPCGGRVRGTQRPTAHSWFGAHRDAIPRALKVDPTDRPAHDRGRRMRTSCSSPVLTRRRLGTIISGSVNETVDPACVSAPSLAATSARPRLCVVPPTRALLSFRTMLDHDGGDRASTRGVRRGHAKEAGWRRHPSRPAAAGHRRRPPAPRRIRTGAQLVQRYDAKPRRWARHDTHDGGPDGAANPTAVGP